MKRMLSAALAFLMILCLFAGCKDKPGSDDQTQAGPEDGAEAAVPVPDGVTASQDNARVFYEIFVGSFSDSNGDGIGDLRGIINRMDYLNDGNETSGKSLGVEGIWLTPIFPSGSYHKYDVDDFYSVDKSFGTLEDLRELAQLCHSRNVKLILDLPINHTSTQNEWFKSFHAARQNHSTEDKYYDFYSCCSKGEPAPEGRVFEPLSGTDDCYECNFYSGMPELNFDNEDVRDTVLDVAKFYLDLGVDGFRFDAAKYIYYGDHSASVDFWGWYMEQLRFMKPDIYTVAEVWDDDSVTGFYYPALNCFDFTMAMSEGMIASAVSSNDINSFTAYIQDYLADVRAERSDAMLVPFIANHDTDRAAGFLPVASGRAQMGANLLLLCPGSPFLYYGEELGMKGSRGGADTDANRRLAMPWGDGDTVKDPIGTTYDTENRSAGTAKDQLADANSLCSYYKKVILLRKANPEIARGTFTALSLPNGGGFISEWNGSKVLVLHNASGSPITVSLADLNLTGFTRISDFVGLNEATLEGGVVTLGAQTSVVLR